MILDRNDYLPYVTNNKSLFYDSNETAKVERNFTLNLNLSSDWIEFSNQYWHYMIFSLDKLPQQGWKIHISANPNDCELVLNDVAHYLVDKHITFKFIPSYLEFIRRNSKYGDRTESGKFITIYPKDIHEFKSLLENLSNIIVDYEEGPYILSDKQWKDTNLYFRYGGFIDNQRVINGEKKHVIYDPLEQKFVEDTRNAYYSVPNFIKEPLFVQNMEKSYSDTDFSKLQQYRIEGAIHFSNAGGVYLAQKSNKTYILKEGRPYAGLDAGLEDGYSRIKREFDFLTQLKDIKNVVNVDEYFKAWKHNYISEEYIKGITLQEFITKNYPFNGKKLEFYKKLYVEILSQLTITLQQIHAKNIAIGDLQPENIILTIQDNKLVSLKLIDFETANYATAKFDPTLATDGFVNTAINTYDEADWYALYRVSRYMLLPIESGTDFAPQLEKIQNSNIEKYFGKNILKFLNDVKSECLKYVSNLAPFPAYYNKTLTVPKHKITLENIQVNIDELANGIINNLDFNSSNLIKGDIAQYDSNLQGYSISNGAFGALYALYVSHKVDGNLKEKISIWLSKNTKQIFRNINGIDIGLYDGSAGIISALLTLGYTKEGLTLYNKVKEEINISNVTDITIKNGLAGLGLLALEIDDMEFCSKISQRLLVILRKDSLKIEAGLINGSLGAVLFLWKYAKKVDNKTLRKETLDILELIIKEKTYHDSKGIYIKRSSKLLPYLNDGSAGLAILLMQLGKDDKRLLNKNKALVEQIMKTNDVFLSFFNSLFDGFSGLLEADNMANLLNYPNSLDKKLELLNNYLIGNGDETLVSGRYGYKFSMDIETGASGLLLTLVDIQEKEFDLWLPLKFKLKM